MIVCVCISIILWPLPVIHRHKLALAARSQSNRGDDILSTPPRMNSHHTNSETHPVFSAPSSTITRDDKYSSISKSQQCGAFAADWLGWDLHNAWAEITLNNNRLNMNGQFKIYGNKTVNKQQFEEQKSLSAVIPQPQLNVLILSLAHILSQTLNSHIYLRISLLISAIMILHYHNK